MAEEKYVPEKERQRLIETFSDLPQKVGDMYAGICSMLYPPLFPPICRICYAREQKKREEEEGKEDEK